MDLLNQDRSPLCNTKPAMILEPEIQVDVIVFLPQKYKYDPGPPDQLLVLHPRVWLASYRGLPHRHPELPDGESQVPREGRDALGVRRLQTDPHRLQALPLLTSWNPGEKMT